MASLPFRNMTLIYYQLFHNSLPQVSGTPPHLVPSTVIWHLKCNNHNGYLQPSREYTNLFLCRLSYCTEDRRRSHLLNTPWDHSLSYTASGNVYCFSLLSRQCSRKWEMKTRRSQWTALSRAGLFFKRKDWPRLYIRVCTLVQEKNQVTKVSDADGRRELEERHSISVAIENFCNMQKRVWHFCQQQLEYTVCHSTGYYGWSKILKTGILEHVHGHPWVSILDLPLLKHQSLWVP